MLKQISKCNDYVQRSLYLKAGSYAPCASHVPWACARPEWQWTTTRVDGCCRKRAIERVRVIRTDLIMVLLAKVALVYLFTFAPTIHFLKYIILDDEYTHEYYVIIDNFVYYSERKVFCSIR